MVTLVQRETKDCKGRWVKREIKAGPVSLVQPELQVPLGIRVTQALPVLGDSRGQKEIAVKMDLMDHLVLPDSKDQGGELVYRVSRETGDNLERGETQEIQDHLALRALQEISALT